MKIPELLSPAGTLRNMRYAFAYGADAVYAGQPRYSLRVRNNDFGLDNIAIGIEEAHSQGKKFYIASNIAPHNSKIKTFMDDIKEVIALNPDALIMSDPGLIMMVREAYPEQEVHLSVQANATNYATVKFWYQQGIKRVILSRELSIKEIEEIKTHCPEMELEVFVHGALCMAYSGRCLLSGYFNHRDPNQGTCTNACRWKYDLHEATQNEAGDIIAVSQSEPTVQTVDPQSVFLLQEKERPGEYMPVFEDEHGTYIMNSKDLRAVQHVNQFTHMGIDSLKIEGRTKSHYYVARTAQVYRQAIDDAVAGKPFNMKLMDELEKLAHRGYTEGFYRRHVHDEYQNYETGNSIRDRQLFVGEISDKSENTITVEVKNRFEVGNTLEIMTPHGNQYFQLNDMESTKGQSIDIAPGSGHRVVIRLPDGMTTNNIDSMPLLMKNL
ncbi:prephenate-dependent tRNA uridine(34) hydroxylase TrhP [Kangiella aquimarina]|uniref:tRNA 5-hydroxyuridine modification protein YegQ n=1 Tax=Kangiella aquimarina TaxID=261965 RepID=A0ABZ0X1N7_9GAMM|nr:tRNA 5-hydroxyuridine modification protein YegQ [Kangiella aquimarina]WQG84496.1 tRNA 5-hydroxyuridine modification protein YegQ [Kangiella aquimarina]